MDSKSKFRTILLVSAVLMGWSSRTAHSQPPTADAKAVAAESADVERWIKELDSPEFTVRERATERLVRADIAAIAPILSNLDKASAEESVRAIHIIQQLARSTSIETQDAAFAALEKIAESDKESLHQRAILAIAASAEFLSDQAVTELARRGARVEQSFIGVGGIRGERLLNVELGDNWTGTDRDLRHLRRMFLVSEVTLTGRKVTDEWLERVAEMPNLTHLRLSRMSLSKRGVVAIKKLKQLIDLSVTSVPIGDDILDDVIELKNVQRFKFFGTRITQAGAERIRTALPNSDLDYRGVYLGIKSAPTVTGMSPITYVEPETPAAKAGLMPGDVIVKFGGSDVATFDALTKLIKSHSPGDKVDVEFERNGQLLKKLVVFE